MGRSVLLVEDDAALAAVVELTLRAAGMEVVTERDGADALERFGSGSFDLVLLDLRLPSVGGLEVCRRIRYGSQVPLLVLTALDDTADVVAGLEAGADDYLTKPFEGPELLARIRAVQRRTGSPDAGVRRIRDLEIDPQAFVLRKRGTQVHLSATEFRLLLDMAAHQGQVMTRDALLQRVWGYGFLGDSRVVDTTIQRLRAKIEDDPRAPQLLATVRGVGYRLEAR